MSKDADLFERLRELRPAPPRARRGRRGLKVGLVALLALAILFVATAGAVWLHVQSKFRQTHDPSLLVDPLPPGEPMNVLVLGSDRRDVIEGAERTQRQFRGGSGQRADTIILVHLSGDRKRAVLMHFPRDLRVRIPGRSGHDKINAAYAYGGPNLVMRTLRSFSGLGIHHYVEINFASFRSIVNSVGGVDICVDRSYNDPKSGLRIPRPDCYHFDGDMALAFARARVVDPDGDFGRIRRQQRLIRSLMNRVTSLGFLANIPGVIRLADSVSKGVVTDKNLSLGLVRQIASRVAGFNQRSVDFRVVPSYSDTIGGVSYVIARPVEARALFQALDRDERTLPPYGKTPLSIPEPADVTVTVLNGTEVKGLGRQVAQDLEEAGFDVRRVATAEDPVERTTILYRPGAELKVNLIRRHFPGAQLRQSVREQLATDVVVIVGPDVAARATASPTPSPA